ncbi:MAG: hypothetical protein DMG49_24590 [Acidobacteria bacterium]|nr:MAG: hypothetical protein DMG49_24590 [Acidobacteriota bacterium]
MDSLTRAHSLLVENDMPAVQEYKVELAEFPRLDKSKRNIEGLREIASHLHGKTAARRISRAGFVGDS